MSTTRLLVGPFNRVEGDLEVRLEVADGRVQAAHVNATMYRGFEQMLLGKDPHDALVYVPRICGICSVSQSVAAAYALRDAAGLAPQDMPANGRHALNLMLATENLADHLTHFYLFFMPDFTRPVYADRPWFAAAQARFAPLQGHHARQATAARQRWFTILGTLGGKWPHTQSVLPGGSARAIDLAERLRLLGKVREFRAFLEQTLFAAPLEAIASLDSEAALMAWWQQAAPDHGDLRLFLTIAADLALGHLGRGEGPCLSYGAYVQPDGQPAMRGGVWDAAQGVSLPMDLAQITEDATHAWLDGDRPLHPHDGQTLPDADKPAAYTWNKAPRLAGRVVETGAVARQLNDGHPLIRDTVARSGTNVRTRVLARLLELARVVPMMEDWLRAVRPGEPWHQAAPLPDTAQATGLAEAARGALGHWVRIDQGRIANYQIVAPTSWNFSPRDAEGTPGPLEQALVGVPVQPGETTPVAVQHVVRSFDPCMVCTVH
ncbi:nickel-dependent hydrogenase large subunit [Aquabacterium sp.]|uniref:nickel-dependent hydrogenase large subunit n=1 Tax=Aquabacterium sp. TaxID=1872578 RepID=UPI0035C6E228